MTFGSLRNEADQPFDCRLSDRPCRRMERSGPRRRRRARRYRDSRAASRDGDRPGGYRPLGPAHVAGAAGPAQHDELLRPGPAAHCGWEPHGPAHQRTKGGSAGGSRHDSALPRRAHRDPGRQRRRGACRTRHEWRGQRGAARGPGGVRDAGDHHATDRERYGVPVGQRRLARSGRQRAHDPRRRQLPARRNPQGRPGLRPILLAGRRQLRGHRRREPRGQYGDRQQGRAAAHEERQHEALPLDRGLP